MSKMKTRKPGLPPPKTRERDMKPFLEGAREQLMRWRGDTGPIEDRVVTYGDLQDSGLGQINPRGPGGDGELAPPEGPVYTVGPLSNLITSPIFEMVLLEWEGTNQRHYSLTEVWRNTEDNLGTAVLRGTEVAPVFSDNATPGQTYYYWVRAVSTSGTPGPFNATAGTKAVTKQRPKFLLDELTGEITESELYGNLNDRIDLIDTADNNLMDRMSNAESAIDTAKSNIDQIEVTLDSVENAPEWSSSNTYAEDDLVVYSGGLYRALEAITTTPGTAPDSSSKWRKIGDYETLTGAVGAQATTLDDHNTRITDTEDGVQAVSSRTDAIEAELDLDGDGNFDVSASIETLETTQATQGDDISAQASRLDSIESELDLDGDGNFEVSSSIETLETTQATQGDNISSNASRLDTIETELDVDGDGTIDAKSKIESLETTQISQGDTQDSQGSTLTTHASRLDTIESELDTDGDGSIDAKATIQSIESTQASQGSDISANASRLDTIESELDTDGDGSIDAKATIQSLESTQVSQGDDISANASSISTLQSNVGDNSAAIQKRSEVKVDGGEVSAQWDLRMETTVDGQTLLGGFGLASDGDSVEAGFNVDRFWIGHPNTDYSAENKRFPFIVDGGVVYMDEVMIREAAIGSAQIADLDAGKITAGTMDVALTLTAADITGGSLNINNRFTVDSNGNVQIISASSGARLVMQNEVIKVFDSSGTKRVQLGNLNA